MPKPNPATLPPGVDATVRKDAYLTLTVKATDPDGDYPLHCKWSSEKVGGGTPGAFAEPGERRMEWSEGDKKWKWVTEWRPPGDAVVGDRFRLECRVKDKNGSAVSTSRVVEVIGDGRIVYYIPSYYGYSTNGVWEMNANGTGNKWKNFGGTICRD